MNDMTLELSAASRATLRDAIKRHPGWPDYRAEHDTDMAQMTTKEAIFRCCDALGIDVVAVLRGATMTVLEYTAQLERKTAPAMIEPRATSNPRVIDNDRDEITVTLDGKELRGWSYSNEGERRMKMLAAREYVEGYCDGRDGS